MSTANDDLNFAQQKAEDSTSNTSDIIYNICYCGHHRIRHGPNCSRCACSKFLA